MAGKTTPKTHARPVPRSTYPYVQSPTHISEVISRLRKRVPTSIDVDVLAKMGIALNNERYVIRTLRFLGLLDEEQKPTNEAKELFNTHDGREFESRLSKLIEEAYRDLFDVRGDDAWSLDSDGLIQYFRSADKSSDNVGRKQATTFSCLAELAGKRQAVALRASGAEPKASVTTTERRISRATGQSPVGVAKAKATHRTPKGGGGVDSPMLTRVGSREPAEVGLTVRVEINLPVTDNQKTYDMIFKSLREHLLQWESK